MPPKSTWTCTYISTWTSTYQEAATGLCTCTSTQRKIWRKLTKCCKTKNHTGKNTNISSARKIPSIKNRVAITTQLRAHCQPQKIPQVIPAGKIPSGRRAVTITTAPSTHCPSGHPDKELTLDQCFLHKLSWSRVSSLNSWYLTSLVNLSFYRFETTFPFVFC